VDVPECESFPPAPPDALLRRKIINGFCEAIEPSKFEEAGCAVCGALTLKTELSKLSTVNIDLNVLNAIGLGFTRKERKLPTEPISELNGHVIDTLCQHICIHCKKKVRRRKVPKFALARGLWLGEIPEQLQQLSFPEKLLVGRVRHNQCVGAKTTNLWDSFLDLKKSMRALMTCDFPVPPMPPTYIINCSDPGVTA